MRRKHTRKPKDQSLSARLRTAVLRLKVGHSAMLHVDPQDHWFVERRMAYYHRAHCKDYVLDITGSTVKIRCVAQFAERYVNGRWVRDYA